MSTTTLRPVTIDGHTWCVESTLSDADAYRAIGELPTRLCAATIIDGVTQSWPRAVARDASGRVLVILDFSVVRWVGAGVVSVLSGLENLPLWDDDALEFPEISPGLCPDCGELADLYDASTNRALCANGHNHAVSALVRTAPAPRLAWRKARDYDRLLSIAAEVDARIDAYEPPARRYTVNIPHAIPTPELLGCRVAR